MTNQKILEQLKILEAELRRNNPEIRENHTVFMTAGEKKIWWESRDGYGSKDEGFVE